MRNNARLYREVEKRLQLAKEKKNKLVQPKPSEEEEEKKVEALLEKYLGKHVKKEAEVERNRRSLPVDDPYPY